MAGGISLLVVGIVLIVMVSAGVLKSGKTVVGGAGAEGVGGGFLAADLFTVIGAILTLIGIIVMIAGFAASPKPPVAPAPSVVVTQSAPPVTVITPELEKKTKRAGKPKGMVKSVNFCPNCGNRLPGGAKFCIKCGHKVEFT